MIFVTVGTGKAGFNDLVEAMDAIAPQLDKPVIMQIGYGEVVPSHTEYFRFTDRLPQYIEQAELVVTGGGVGTIFELIYANKKAIAVNNHHISDKHQSDILEKVSTEQWLYVCNDLANLKDDIEHTLRAEFQPYQPPVCTIEQEIVQFMNSHMT